MPIKDLVITSQDFADGGRLDDRFTGTGEDISPALRWHGAPDGTVSFAVVCHDPDAPLPDGYTHWVVTGIPATVRELTRGDTGYHQGPNGWGTSGYRGPMPPPDHGDHRYYFWVFALDVACEEPLSRRDFVDRWGGHVLEQARIVGTYSR